MHVHPPKPLHGWKEFANEIFVIVVGVLIALGLEQVVEQWHWQHKVAEGEERLRAELQSIYVAGVGQIAAAPCINRQYDALLNRVMTSGATLDPARGIPPSERQSFIGTPPSAVYTSVSTMESPVWDALKDDGTIVHMPARQQRRLGAIYFQTQRNNDVANQFSRLTELTYPIRLDASLRYQMIARIEAEREKLGRLLNAAAQVTAFAREMGYAPSDAETEVRFRREVATMIAVCQRNGYPLADWKAALAKQPSLETWGL